MFLTFTKKVLSVKRADMRKFVAAAICLPSLSLHEHDHQKKMYKGSEDADWKKVLRTAAQEGR